MSDLNNVYTVTGRIYIFAADSNFAYDIEVTARDSHSAYTRSNSASTAFTLMNWHPDGKGMGLGMVAEATGLACALPLKLYGGIESVAADKATAARLALGIGKHLWGTSTWGASQPTITVPELQNYTLFLLKVQGVNLNILATRVGGNFRGHGGYPMDNGTRIYAISGLAEGTTLTMTLCHLVLHTASGSHSASADVNISDIWGIF